MAKPICIKDFKCCCNDCKVEQAKQQFMEHLKQGEQAAQAKIASEKLQSLVEDFKKTSMESDFAIKSIKITTCESGYNTKIKFKNGDVELGGGESLLRVLFRLMVDVCNLSPQVNGQHLEESDLSYIDDVIRGDITRTVSLIDHLEREFYE